MKIKTQTTIKTLKGEDIKDGEDKFFTIGKAMSEIIISSKIGGKMKCFSLAQKFYNDKEVDLDQADMVLVKNLVESTDMYNNLVTGQLLVILSEDTKK